MNLTELKKKPIGELIKIAEFMGLEGMARNRKQDIIFAILKRHAMNGEEIFGDGVLEILSDGFGFLRSAAGSYLAGPDDIYVSPSQIRRFNLRTGDTITGTIRPPKEGERYFALLKVNQINYDTPENSRNKILFENLTPLFPTEQLVMELGNGTTEDLTARVVDLVAPIGKGQRSIIVAPPKAGKTMLLQNIAQSIVRNNPEVFLIVLLIGLAHFCAYSYLAPFFKNVAGFNGTTISSLLLLYGIAGIFGNAFAGYSGNLNVRYTLAFVGTCFAIVFFGFPIFAIHEFGAIVLTALWGFAFGAFPTSANIWMFVHAPHAVEKGMPLFVGMFQVMIATGSLLGGYVVDHFNENTLIYGVLSFVALALISTFTLAKGLNNPKATCEN
ncbi:Rho termination factor N-terminal domain-containing protein [Acinetobacter baumannii]|uniref:Rho termination factor N-terminal domain-containing protein n=1 Tax=Acinetobacter baumannii TaxID=470 RepID=UPI0027414734|nr:Rho termination factor N-terminal domain-containing protein [Acinetobacter baumannii]MDP7933236.1 Rho termination factor N-terminal domain-containing protein [Acinetobacter baumannii]